MNNNIKKTVRKRLSRLNPYSKIKVRCKFLKFSCSNEETVKKETIYQKQRMIKSNKALCHEI